jgi:hypothetical protein
MMRPVRALIRGLRGLGWADEAKLFLDFFKNLAGKFKILKPIIAGVKALFKSFGTGFLRGLKWIAWPITILMSVIDFFRGFSKGMEEGTIIEGITTGLSEAMKGFFYLPIKLIGWVTDWILSKFDMNMEGGSAKALFDAIEVIFEGIAWVFNTLWNGIVHSIAGILSLIPMDWARDAQSSVMEMRTGVGGGADPEKAKAIAQRTANANDVEKAKAGAEGRSQQQQRNTVAGIAGTRKDELTQTVDQMGDKISTSIQQIKFDSREIPTAPEETYLALMGDALGGA